MLVVIVMVSPKKELHSQTEMLNFDYILKSETRLVCLYSMLITLKLMEPVPRQVMDKKWKHYVKHIAQTRGYPQKLEYPN